MRLQSAITTSDSEPEPDIAIVPGPADRYVDQHPVPADIALIIEIAESSLAEDRRDKQRIYARAGISLYWIVNLIDSQLEVYSDPSGPAAAPAYRKREIIPADGVATLSIGGERLSPIPVRDLLP